MNFLRSSYQAAQGQGFASRQFANRRQPRVAQFLGPPARVAADQADHPKSFPGMPPVVDRLMTDPALLGNRGWMLSLAQHQQACCPQPSVPPGMVERQLEQGFAFAGTQRQGYFHFPLSVGDALRKQVSIQLQRIT